MKPLVNTAFEAPARYHKDMLYMMVRDACMLYAYWELSDRKRWLLSRHFECDYSSMPKALRIYDVTCIYFNGSNANSYFDIPTTPEADNWYIHHLQPGRTYLADWGTYTIEGEFLPLLRSNAVITPRQTVAPWGAPLVEVVSEVKNGKADGRIEPHFFENVQPYSPNAR
ncbi:DUF4912 domain-containing protein [Paenibacillus eucommiae]|uniref:DUF4912 domain-containing protein n=1 Tax=Paenibacillus eucommiae TaxID=1355755 RepID=A0ABS4J173_9BACL|nr:DUF4912 domain-containing protein [Paenibacillus eucommiae]MBP1993574.1 hypothetical protein [Paenibacillus eucommiae]